MSENIESPPPVPDGVELPSPEGQPDNVAEVEEVEY